MSEESVVDTPSSDDDGRGPRPVRRGLRARSLVHLWRPPRESRVLLSEMRVFANCDRRQILRVARWGDVIEVQPGDVLVREDRTDYWFFVVLDGSVQVTSHGKEVRTLRRGDHFGEIAIIGFRPQPATVTAAEPTVLFVLGRRFLLTLGATSPAVQRALFPDIAAGDYTTFARALQEQGRRHWERLRPRYALGETVVESRPNPPGQPISWTDALELLSHRDLDGAVPLVQAPPVVAVSTTRLKVMSALVAAAVLAAVALVYHPPVAVLTAGRSVDVVQDISITGAEVHGPTGRYLLTPVNVSRPNLAGTLFAWALRRRVVTAESPGAEELDPQSRRSLAHEAFLSSHRHAIALAEKRLGVDATGVSIAIRDRGITGPSAGLIYALAIVDMLDEDDLADGRAIAATGELRPNGEVARVAFVSLKARSARDGGAVLFLVPASQRSEAREEGLKVLGVGSLEEAFRAINQASRD